jgi:secreted PhoX family phosphatase
MTMTRRSFLTRSVLAAGGGVMAAGPFSALAARAAGGVSSSGAGSTKIPSPYGEPSVVTGGGDLLLPPGFHAVRFGEEGSPLSDGTPTPARHDGMAAYNGPGRLVHLVRNHEVTNTGGAFGNVNLAYDPVAGGGNTPSTPGGPATSAPG